jgi:O-antigen/teichoic acid export membrane protein
VSGLFGFGETGQFSLANDIGVRVLAAIASTLDVLLFQLAVRADETHGPARARAQLAENMTTVLAIVLPTAIGLWLVLPSFEALIVPEAFRGPFARYLAAMLPGLAAFVLLQYTISPIFQIAKRPTPMIIIGLSACAADGLFILFLPRGADGFSFALAQTGAQIVGLLTGIVLAATTRPHWPRWRDLASVAFAAGTMAVIVLPLRARPPSVVTLLAEVVAGVVAYTALAYLLDIAKLRARLTALLEQRRAAGGLKREGAARRPG